MPAVRESSLLAHAGTAPSATVALDIIDIRSNTTEINLKDEVSTMFSGTTAARKLPTLLLYDERGLQLFEDITYLAEYYLTNYEIELLKKNSAEIAAKVPAGAMVIELGSGNLRKVCLLLRAFEALEKPIDYYALDLDQKELERTLAQVPEFKHVRCHGLLGTYDDGRDWMKQPAIIKRPKCILHLGSSIGNFHREDAASFLEGFANTLQPNDSMIVAVDACDDPSKVYHAYNDSEGVTHQFILNGLAHANEIFGEEVFQLEDWRVIGEYVYDVDGGRHQACVSPVRETVAMGTVIQPDERVQIEQSLKYSKIGRDKLWRGAGLRELANWSRGTEYGLHMLQRAEMPFNFVPSVYASGPLPTLQEWKSLWVAWDTVTRKMLPDQELNEKPIKLRNACIFYLGHIPTFLDIQLSKTTQDPPTDPASYYTIFERGIDPDVDNPEHCHTHSEIPDEWPPVQEILTYQDCVRARLTALYANGQEKISRLVGRAIWLGFEHEAMHLETLMYMMLQSDKTLPPPDVVRPDFEVLARKAIEERVPNEWFDIPEQTITIGTDDLESGTDRAIYYGWDNEKPARQQKVAAFQAKGRAITNEEYAQYLHSSKIDRLPTSWSSQTFTSTAANGTNGKASGASTRPGALPQSFLQDKSVRTIYGLISLEQALSWPVFASYDELSGCAAWMGGRIPTFEEARSIYEYVDSEQRRKLITQTKLAKRFPAVNGHLVNNGVEETPPPDASSAVGEGPNGLFVDLSGANVGFAHWHPVAVTSRGRGDTLAGQAGMGGVWEWTSSSLRAHEGFEPMTMYPGYTADFFDEKHNVVLGGSWATHPRIAGRKSFVNWYQRNYAYAWTGARLVRDVQ